MARKKLKATQARAADDRSVPRMPCSTTTREKSDTTEVGPRQNRHGLS